MTDSRVSTSTLSAVLRRVACVVVLGVLLVVAGCGSDPATQGLDSPGGHDHGSVTGPGPGPQPGQKPDVSAYEAMTRIWSYDPALDAGPAAGWLRARPWLTGPLAEVADGGRDLRGDAQWQGWQTKKQIVVAIVKVAAQVDADTAADRVGRYVVVAQQAIGPDGTTEDLPVLSFHVALARGSDGCWRMSSMTLAD